MPAAKYWDGTQWVTIEAVPQQTFDIWHVVGDAGTGMGTIFGGSPHWSHISGLPQLAFRKFPDGRVKLRGGAQRSISTSGVGDIVFYNLPAAYRPPGTIVCSVSIQGFSTLLRLDVQPGGSLVLQTAGVASGSWIPLDDIEWDTESVTSYPTITGPQRVTSLPGSPVDGQEIYYVADAANGVVWHLRYNAGSASPYKWEYLGGSPLRISSGTANTTGSGSVFSNQLTDGTAITKITAPLAGDYSVDYFCEGYHGSTWGTVYNLAAGAGRGAGGTLDNNPQVSSSGGSGGGNQVGTIVGSGVVVGVSAGQAIQMYYLYIPVVATYRTRTLAVVPVRVGP